MSTYHGSCHCGRVKFTVETDIDKVISCNCSICTKKGALHHRVSAEQFELLEGEDCLTPYQFNTKVAHHYFCRFCGIHPFSNPRAAPEMYSINIRCLDDFDMESESYEVISFDGRNWEDTARQTGESSTSG